MDRMVDYIRAGAMALGGVVGMMIGRLDGLLIALLIFMALDYVTGITVAVLAGSLNSQVGFKGIAKKVFILLLVVVANVVDVYVLGSGSAVRGMVIFFYLANEGLSILENAGKLGVPYPDRLRSVLEQLKEDGHAD